MITKFKINSKIVSFYVSYIKSTTIFKNYDLDIILNIINELRYIDFLKLHYHYIGISLTLNYNKNIINFNKKNIINFNNNYINIYDNYEYLYNLNSLLVYNKTKNEPKINKLLKKIILDKTKKIYFSNETNVLKCNKNMDIYNNENYICEINYSNKKDLDNILKNLTINFTIYDINDNILAYLNKPFNLINNIDNIDNIEAIFNINEDIINDINNICNINYNILNNYFTKKVSLLFIIIPNKIKLI